jgi:two-component system, NtrC family, response regulator HydG
MRAEDLNFEELFEVPAEGGVMRFAGERALILNAASLGLLRKELINTLGIAAARGILTRFGYAHGWRMAENLKKDYTWDSVTEWHKAGGRLHELQGLVTIEPVPRDPHLPPRHYAHAEWHDSYEAVEHLIHFGPSIEPVCWTLCGFASGYLSCCHGRAIYCVEERCRGKGDSFCLMAGGPLEEWDEETRRSFIFFEHDCLDAALKQLTTTLKKTERKLTTRRSELARANVKEQATGVLAQSESMRRVVEMAYRVARVQSTVLINGESGVGKEVVARLIHDESPRAARPFIAINCAAVPDALLESELFGHVRGAFTGASQDRPGLFEAAAGGTLLLDEIGDLPLGMQSKLLRVLQEREVRRVGENRTRPVDVRVLAATHRDLAAECAAGRFREDLYYRLRVIEIRVPPLRERRDDILPLARKRLAEVARISGMKVTGFTPQAAQQLLRWSWPGNIRELQNVVERAVVLAEGSRVSMEDLPEEIRTAAPARGRPGKGQTLADAECEHILAAVRFAAGNKTRAAIQLGIGPATLFRKLKKYGKADLVQ